MGPILIMHDSCMLFSNLILNLNDIFTRFSRAGMKTNSFRAIRESLLISKAELARKANISTATITRIENGMPCRLETKQKIILALGYKIADWNQVFANDKESFFNDNGGRRSGVDRRQFQYATHIPELRAQERRNGVDRRLKPRKSE